MLARAKNEPLCLAGTRHMLSAPEDGAHCACALAMPCAPCWPKRSPYPQWHVPTTIIWHCWCAMLDIVTICSRRLFILKHSHRLLEGSPFLHSRSTTPSSGRASQPIGEACITIVWRGGGG